MGSAADAVLNRVGAAEILENVAAGRTMAAIARSLNVSPIEFRRWVERNIPATDMEEAARSAAEHYVDEAIGVARSPALTPVDVQRNKHLADRLLWMAERLHPQKWAPPAKQTENAPPVSITLNMPGVDGLIGRRASVVLDAKAENVKSPAEAARLAAGSSAAPAAGPSEEPPRPRLRGPLDSLTSLDVDTLALMAQPVSFDLDGD